VRGSTSRRPRKRLHALVVLGPLPLDLPGPLRPEDHLQLHVAGAERALELEVRPLRRQLSLEDEERDPRSPLGVLPGRGAVGEGVAASAVDEGGEEDSVPAAARFGPDERRDAVRDHGDEALPDDGAARGADVLLAGPLLEALAVTGVALEESAEALEPLGPLPQGVELLVGEGTSGGDGREQRDECKGSGCHAWPPGGARYFPLDDAIVQPFDRTEAIR
jgi:hypothetical protein